MLTTSSRAPITKLLVALCCGVYVLQLSSFGKAHHLEHLLGLIPRDFVQRVFLWQPVTYLFLHGSLAHLVVNMWALWILGPMLEGYYGSRRFLAYFLLIGAGAGLFLILVNPLQPLTTIGCSASVFGILLALPVLSIASEADRLLLFFVIPVSFKVFLLSMIGVSFFGTFAYPNSTFSHVANLGGLLFAYLTLNREGLPFGVRCSETKSSASIWTSQ